MRKEKSLFAVLLMLAGLPGIKITKSGGTFAVGTAPSVVVIDGANIWVANFSSNNVTKLPVFP